jgi:hypothetical protein
VKEVLGRENRLEKVVAAGTIAEGEARWEQRSSIPTANFGSIKKTAERRYAADALGAFVVQSIPELQGGKHEEDSDRIERNIERNIPHR